MEKTQCPFPGNDKIYIALIITLLLLSLSFPLFAQDGTTKNAVNIGLLFDGKDIQANSDIALLR
ncbi:MAG: hypothetical protein GY729_05465, partial [Desulfobacteraceae bacterium]|nr:hypothetical protein [Desulfobacteraceae bacterium]